MHSPTPVPRSAKNPALHIPGSFYFGPGADDEHEGRAGDSGGRFAGNLVTARNKTRMPSPLPPPYQLNISRQYRKSGQ